MATAPAALVARARREIQHHFFSNDAVRPDRAVEYQARSRIEQRQFDRMRGRGIIREEGLGRYWLDVIAYDDDIRRRHRTVRSALLIIIVVLLFAFIASAMRI
jgi:hypothetical protein